MNSSPIFEEDMNMKDPFEIFKKWLEAARKVCKSAFIANSFCLTTVNEECMPSGRLVTLTAVDDDKLYFMTNSNSRKGQQISKNPQVCLTFHWPGTFRMVIIDAIIEPGSLEMADEVFRKRPTKHKVWAYICEQGTTIDNPQSLNDLEKYLTKKYGEEIPRPPTWVIYVVIPKVYHFFLSQKNMKHDRVVYRKPDPSEQIDEEYTHKGRNGWVYERVFP